jgi:ribosomal protein L11 methyltransferase
MRFGRRLWICPGGQLPTTPQASDTVLIELDPGLAFGTGTHPTTALCLEWLDAQPLDGCTVLDYGCGSGILAIAALLLGAARALAVDNDPQALTATRDNAERNGIAAERLSTYLPEQLPTAAAADIVIANILAAPLQTLAPTLARHTSAGGRLALSCIHSEKGAAEGAAYRPWLDLSAPAQRQEWLRLDGRKNR